MKLTNEMKTKVENLLSKTGLDIELIEKESNWEGVYYYQLKVHPVSVYVNVTGAVRFTEKFWYDLNKIVKSADLHVYCNEKKNTFVVTKRESLSIGTYKGGNIARTTSKRTWARIKRKIEKALGYETDLTEYCFRHNYCSELYYSGISLLEAKRLMGHSSLDMVMKIYTHLDAQKEDTAAKLNAINF